MYVDDSPVADDSLDLSDFSDVEFAPETPVDRDPVNPFFRLPRRRRTFLTPRRHSPLRTPPEYTPQPTPEREEFSPETYTIAIPTFNYREVESPGVFMSPFFGSSTPKPDDRSDFARNERREARRKANIKTWKFEMSPITNRRDVDSIFDETSAPWKSPPRKLSDPMYFRAEALPRSPAVQLMREEMLRNLEPRKYFFWHMNNCTKVSMLGSVRTKMVSILIGRVEIHNWDHVTDNELLAMLGRYLKEISEKLITQNLKLPPLAEDDPVFSIVNQKQISIRRIIREFQNKNWELEYKLDNLKKEHAKFSKPLSEEVLRYRAGYRQELVELQDMQLRAKRIVKAKGICIHRCPNQETAKDANIQKEPFERKLDALRQEIVELDEECMLAAIDMNQFVDVVTPHFITKLTHFIRSTVFSFTPDQFPAEVLEAAAKDVSTNLSRIFKEKRDEWSGINDEINDLQTLIDEEEEEELRIFKEIDASKKEMLQLEKEYKKYKSDNKLLEWMLKEARGMLEFNERGCETTFQDLTRLKEQTVQLETTLGITPRGPPELFSAEESTRSTTPNIAITQQPTSVRSVTKSTIGSPIYASSPATRLTPSPQDISMTPESPGTAQPPSAMLNLVSERSPGTGQLSSVRSPPKSQSPFGFEDFIGNESPPPEMLNISGLSGSGSPIDPLEDSRSPIDSLEGSGSSLKKTVIIPSPSKQEQLRMEIEVIPHEIRRSPSGQRVVCDLAVEMQEAARRPPRPIERRNIVVRGTPPISQTVGRRFDRRYGMFTPQSSFRRRHVGVRRPLFEGDFESPESPYGTGRRTHPEFMDLTPRVSTPRSPHATTIEWEK